MRVPSALERPDDAEALIYRVAQESIRNARTHGDATEITIKIEHEGRRAVLTVSDNGRGFGGEAADESGHFGLRLMRDLGDHAGGELEVLSAPGDGASVRLEVPLP
jgi:signal transduction histidine kinase